MLDVVFLAMFAVLPAMVTNIILAKRCQRYAAHKWLQVGLGLLLFVAVVLFEIDNFLHDWRERAEPSPYYANGWVARVLAIHLFFAVPNVFIWAYVTIDALRKFPNPPAPSPYSRRHKLWGWLAAGAMTMTAVTGWIFYWMAFVA